jgi:hypothetical protein
MQIFAIQMLYQSLQPVQAFNRVCIIVESARDVPYRDINLQELILRAHTSIVFKVRQTG